MKTVSLLNDVLKSGDYAGFREVLAGRVQIEARRKRTQRTVRWLALAASIAFMAGWLLMPAPTVAPVAVKISEPAYVIRTAPLSASQLLVTTSATSPEIYFATDHSKAIPSITDSQLLQMFPRNARGLAALDQDTKRFLFLDPKDAAAFMASN